jgi:hypothetical protein
MYLSMKAPDIIWLGGFCIWRFEMLRGVCTVATPTKIHMLLYLRLGDIDVMQERSARRSRQLGDVNAEEELLLGRRSLQLGLGDIDGARIS